MTREDVITELQMMQLRHVDDDGNSIFDDAEIEAIDIAIETLKQKDEIGEWHFNSDPRCGDFVCSECLERSIVCSKYCPNCGVKMEV